MPVLNLEACKDDKRWKYSHVCGTLFVNTHRFHNDGRLVQRLVRLQAVDGVTIMWVSVVEMRLGPHQ